RIGIIRQSATRDHQLSTRGIVVLETKIIVTCHREVCLAEIRGKPQCVVNSSLGGVSGSVATTKHGMTKNCMCNRNLAVGQCKIWIALGRLLKQCNGFFK